MSNDVSRSDLRDQLEAADRQFGRESLFYFTKFCLGYAELQPNPHKEVCKFAEDIAGKDRFGLDLEPRGSFKTSIFSQALPVWLLLRNPNVRILLDSQVLQNSMDNLGVVKAHLASERFRYLFGDYCGNHWSQEEITISKRTMHNLKEPSVRCASPERVQVGPHYDFIIADDLVSDINSKTLEQRRMVKDHFRLLFSLLEPDGKIIVVGTRWHYDDVYDMIAREFPEFKTRIMDAETSGLNGGLYFPERLDKQFLTDQRRRLGRDFYNAQYRNDPAPLDGDAAFQRSWFKRYDTKPSGCYGFIAVDPGGANNDSDEWVMLSAYCHWNGDLYYEDMIRGNFRSGQAWNMLFDLAARVDPITIALETTGPQKYLLESLQDEMRRRGKYLNVTPLAHGPDTSKEIRILRLQPRYQCGAMYHSHQMEPFEEQLLRFPKGKDDMVDAAAMILEVAVAPRTQKRQQTPINSVDDLIWRTMMGQNKGRYVHSCLGSEI